MALGYRDKIMWVISLGALVWREMSLQGLLVIFVDIIIYPSPCRSLGVVKQSKTRFLQLVWIFTLTNLQTLLPSKARAWHMQQIWNGGWTASYHAHWLPPDPGGLSLAMGFFFQLADLWGFRRETKGLNAFEVCRWRPGDGTLKKLPLGLKSLLPHLSRQRSHPHGNLSPGLGSTFHLCTDCPLASHTFQARHGCVCRVD